MCIFCPYMKIALALAVSLLAACSIYGGGDGDGPDADVGADASDLELRCEDWAEFRYGCSVTGCSPVPYVQECMATECAECCEMHQGQCFTGCDSCE
jgi:hypothetical protein